MAKNGFIDLMSLSYLMSTSLYSKCEQYKMKLWVSIQKDTLLNVNVRFYLHLCI